MRDVSGGLESLTYSSRGTSIRVSNIVAHPQKLLLITWEIIWRFLFEPQNIQEKVKSCWVNLVISTLRPSTRMELPLTYYLDTTLCQWFKWQINLPFMFSFPESKWTQFKEWRRYLEPVYQGWYLQWYCQRSYQKSWICQILQFTFW